MAMDFSGSAGAATPFDLIPKGQVAFAVLTVRGVKASASGGSYLDCELTIDQGQPYAGKKVWDMIGDPQNQANSEKYREMGTIAITRILEAGKGAGPNNKAGYQINQYSDLSGLRVAIKIGIEPGTGGHPDKNRVAEYLTPNPASQSGHKGFQQLLSGVFNTATAEAPKPAANGFAGFGGGATTAAPAATGGFGNAGGGTPAASSGFPQPQTSNGAQSAADQSGPASQGGFAGTTTATDQSPSDPSATPQWLQQAGG